jgi:hypothetical protein
VRIFEIQNGSSVTLANVTVPAGLSVRNITAHVKFNMVRN